MVWVGSKMNKIKELLKYWGQVFLIPIYWFSYITPRNKKIWLFGSTFGNRFADNPKYFYLYVNQYRKKEIRSIWISRNLSIVRMLQKEGYEAYYYKSFKGVFFCLIGGVYIFDNYSKDISFWLSGGAKKVNLWHGIPLKKINMDNEFDYARNPRNLKERLYYTLRRMSDEKPNHYVATTSKFLVNIFSSAFATKNVLVTGYPRNDNLINTNYIKNIYTKEELKLFKYLKNYKKVVLYMPTFRESEGKFFDVVNIREFNQFLDNENILFCIKLHPKSKLLKEFLLLKSKKIFIVNPDVDPYPILDKVDILVTDYSSIYFDFLLKDKPIIFFDYDYEEYISESRKLYFNYDEFTPGKRVKTMYELMNSLIEDDNYENKRKLIKDRVLDKYDYNNTFSDRLYEKIINIFTRK